MGQEWEMDVCWADVGQSLIIAWSIECQPQRDALNDV